MLKVICVVCGKNKASFVRNSTGEGFSLNKLGHGFEPKNGKPKTKVKKNHKNTRNWINLLDKLINKYNNTVHSTIKMTPTEASKPENKIQVLNNQGYLQHQQLNPKFEVGD